MSNRSRNTSQFHNPCLHFSPYKHSVHYISVRPNAFLQLCVLCRDWLFLPLWPLGDRLLQSASGAGWKWPVSWEGPGGHHERSPGPAQGQTEGKSHRHSRRMSLEARNNETWGYKYWHQVDVWRVQCVIKAARYGEIGEGGEKKENWFV